MNVDFSFCLIFNKELNFSRTESIFQRNTSSCQSNWHSFFWCMGKCYTFQDTHFGWCMWNVILYNIDLDIIFCQMLAYLPKCFCWQMVKPTFLVLVMTDVVIQCLWTTWCYWQMLFAMWLWYGWCFFSSIVMDGIVTFVIIVADWKAMLWDNW